MFKKFPFIGFGTALLFLRIGIASIFLLHAVVRIINGTIPEFAHFLENKGWPAGIAVVWLITVAEIAGGFLLIAGRYIRWVAAVFIFIMVTGIVVIHAQLGWFVGEHGTGGCEYSVLLILALLVIAADAGKQK